MNCNSMRSITWKFGLNIALMVTLMPGVVSAKIYKCKDAGGKDTYQQQPCPSDSEQTQLADESSNWIPLWRNDTTAGLVDEPWPRLKENQSSTKDVMTTYIFKNTRKIAHLTRARIRTEFIVDWKRADHLGGEYFAYYDCERELVSRETPLAVNWMNEPADVQALEAGLVSDPRYKETFVKWEVMNTRAAVGLLPFGDSKIITHVCKP